jgi:hypothetical protein
MSVVLTAVAMAPGCGGGGSSGPPLPLDQFIAQFLVLRCHKVLSCCSSSEIAAIDPMIVDEASCETRLAPTPQSDLALAPALVDAGLVTYDGDVAQKCLDALAALTCETWAGPFNIPTPPQCNGLIEGTVAAGGSCGVSLECASDYCTNASNGGLACAAPVALGVSCELAPCVSGLSCVSSPQSGAPRTCGHPSPDGSACVHDADCTSNFCNTDVSTGLSTCAPPGTCDAVLNRT